MTTEPLEPRLQLSATLLEDLNTETTFNPSGDIVRAGDRTFVVAYTRGLGSELWKLDDNPDRPPKLVADLYPGPTPSAPRNRVAVDGRLLFVADLPARRDVLMRTDGTRDGTTLLADIAPGPSSSHSRILGLFNDRLLIAAMDAEHGVEPWLIPLDD